MVQQKHIKETKKHISDLSVHALNPIAEETFELILSNKRISQIAAAGQFLHIIQEGFMLARPLSIADTDPDKGTVTLIFKINGEGTKSLARLIPNASLRAIGPLGNGFPLDVPQGKHVLLIGGGIGIPPLYFLAKKMHAKGVSVTTVLGYQTRNHVFYESEFSAFGQTITMTDDGTYGKKGLVTAVLSKLAHTDRYYACGPIQMLRAVQNKMQGTDGYLSMEERMGCGVGTCMACVIPSQDGGYRKICSDGPVFPAGEVYL